MLMLILNVLYVLLAIAMIAMILMQRGAGAQAGSGFGAGASATVFGASGSANFLSKSTKWLAVVFFAIALFMAWYATHNAAKPQGPAQQDLGVMSQVPAAPATQPAGDGTVPAAPVQAQPAAPASSVPPAPAPQQQPSPSK
ncbi:MAG: preprotein translocase subunit SecG [Lysobacteraceae bacterium]